MYAMMPVFDFRLSPRKNEFGEYVIKCYKNSTRYEEGDYFTNDWDDAQNTLLAMQIQQEKIECRQ